MFPSVDGVGQDPDLSGRQVSPLLPQASLRDGHRGLKGPTRHLGLGSPETVSLSYSGQQQRAGLLGLQTDTLLDPHLVMLRLRWNSRLLISRVPQKGREVT